MLKKIFKISDKEGINYSKESGDENKIHLDKIIGYNSIYNDKIVHGTLIFLKFLKFSKKNKLKNYSIKIIFKKGFFYNLSTIVKKNKITQINGGEALIEYNKNIKINKTLKLHKVYRLKISDSTFESEYEKINLILNKLSYYVGMINPGYNSIIADINLKFSENIFFSKKINIFTSSIGQGYPIKLNRLEFGNYSIDFTTIVRPKLNYVNIKPSKIVKNLILNSTVPVLILGASSGIGKEILELFMLNKKIPIIASFNRNLILKRQKNLEIIKIDINKDLKKISQLLNKFNELRIYYFCSPKIYNSQNNNFNIKNYSNYFINYPKEIFKNKSKNLKLEFFYPSTSFIDDNIHSDYVKIKSKAEKILESKNNLNINILRIEKINTKQNLGMFNKNLPNFTQILNSNQLYQKKFFFI